MTATRVAYQKGAHYHFSLEKPNEIT